MFFTYSKWLELPLLTRVKIAEVFGIPKTGATEVFSNTVMKDGYAIKDIEEKLTLEAMQAYIDPVDGGDDAEYIFNRVVEKVMYVPPTPVVAQEVITRTTVTETIVRPTEPVAAVISTENVGKVVESLSEITKTEGGADYLVAPTEKEVAPVEVQKVEEVAPVVVTEVIIETKPESHATETKKSSKK